MAGAAGIGNAALSVISLEAALRSGDTFGAVVAGAQTISYAASAYASFAGQSIADLSSGLGSAVGAIDSVLPYAGIITSIISGDPVGIAIAVASYFVPVVGQIYAVFNLVTSLFADNTPPEAWGNAQAEWFGLDAVSTAGGANGGLERAQGTYDAMLNYLDTMAADSEAANPSFPLGVIPNRLSSITFRDQSGVPGFTLTDTDPLTGAQNPVVHYDFETLRPYDAPPGSDQASQGFYERFLRTALGRGAIAPMWEVATAAAQTQAGDPSGGLSEEERAGRAGKLAAPLAADATSQIFRPVALDLNGDGVQTTATNPAGTTQPVEFNVDDSGFYKSTEWLSNSDGFLFLDRNMNGFIDSGKELFSNALVALNQRGLQGMKWVDSNYDGKITVADPVWDALKVWNDLNGDGVRNFIDLNGNGVPDAGEPDELATLAELGITELNYNMGTFTQNGQIKEMSSPDLTADTAGTRSFAVPEGIVVETSNGEVSLNVTQVDDLSVLSPNRDGVTTLEDHEMVIDSALLLANDELGGNTGGHHLSITGVSNFTHGTGWLDAATGKIHYTPDANYFGPASFEYTLEAETGQTSTATVDIDITNVNDAPVARIEQVLTPIYGYDAISSRNGYTRGAPHYTPWTGYKFVGSGSNGWRIYGTHNTIESNVDLDGPNGGRVVVTDVDNPGGSFTFEVSAQPQGGQGSVDANGNYSYTNWIAPNVVGTRSDGVIGSNTRHPKKTYSSRADPFTIKVTDSSGASTTVQAPSVHSGAYTPSSGGGGGKKPISIDLDGDGFAFTDVNDSNIFFDINGDGFKHRMAWPVAGDGLLAFDANGNGIVDNGSEISFISHDVNAQTDLEALKAFDSNNDGIFSALDDRWSQFGVWQDSNQNGITDLGEFQTLGAMGIASIGLNSNGQFQIINGQTVHGVGTVTKADGTTLDMADVTLAYSDEVLVTNPDGTTDPAVKPPFAPSGEVVTGTAGKDLLLGNNGNTTIEALDGADVVFSSIGNDYINSGTGNDAVYAGEGNDVVMAGTGDDVVFAGAGNDLIFGEDGHDALMGEAGNDIIFGGAGNDLISGDTGNDLLSGDSGNDQIYGGSGNAALFGGAGDDELAGMEGDDRLDGGAGNDLLDGGLGADEMVGGLGNDTYSVDDAGDTVTENLNEGVDTVHASIDYTLGANVENLTLTGAANLNGNGNALDNVITGNSGDNLLDGAAGNDVLEGGAGNDTLQGGVGNDRYIFNPGDGTDIIVDASGLDTLYVGGNLTEANLDGVRSGNDMIVTIRGTADSMTLTNWFVQAEGVNRIEFADGSFLDGAGIESLLNRPPVANPDSITAFEDGGIVITPTVSLLANDTDPNSGDILTVESVGVSAVGAAVSLVGSEIHYDIGNRFQELKAGDVVHDSFEYTINDGNGATATSIVNVTIVGTNDGPVANVDFGSAIEDGGPVMITGASLMANDSDVDQGDTMSIASVSATSAAGASVSFVNGDVQYDVGSLFQWLGEGQTTIDTFDYTIVDSQGATSTSTVTMTITGTNDVPIVNPDFGAVQEDFTIAAIGNVLSNDSDVDQGTVLQVANAGTYQGAYGTLALNADGSYTYALDNASMGVQSLAEGQVVTETFDYLATDGLAATPSTLTVTITGTNDAPVTTVDTASVQEDLSIVATGNVLANDHDVDQGTLLSVANAGLFAGTYGSLILNTDGSYTYALDNASLGVQSLAEGQVVTETFDYQATDGITATPSTLTVTITGTNDTPVANVDFGAAIEDGGPVVITGASLMANDTDVDQGDTMSIASVSATSAAGAAVSLVNGDVQYDIGGLFQWLGEGKTTTDTFTYTIADSQGATSTTTVAMTITGTNDAPVANPDFGAVQEDVIISATGNVLTNDSDIDQGDLLSVANTGVFVGMYGTLTLNGDGSYSYILDNASMGVQSLAEGQVVIETFDYQTTDGIATTPSTLTMSITGTNDAPIVVADFAAVQEDVTVSATGNVLTNDSDIDQGDVLSVANAGVFAGSYGTLTLNADGSYSYALDNASIAVQSLAKGQVVTETFDYLATDGMAQTPSTLTVSITGTNDAPVVNIPLSDQMAFEEVPFSYQMPADAFTDIDQGDVLSYSATMANGDPLPDWLQFDPVTQTFNSDMPDGSAAGIWNVRVTATDQHGASAFSDFQLDVADLTLGTPEEDVISGSALRDVIYGFGDDDVLMGQGANDVLIGGSGMDILNGGAGDDILIAEQPMDASQLGGAPLLAEPQNIDEEDDSDHESDHDSDHDDEEHHELASDSEDDSDDDHESASNNLLDGGAGNDRLYGGAGNDFLIGGTGNDLIDTGAGSNVVAFNAGDGLDTVLANPQAENTLTLGGGINFEDLQLSRSGNDLVLDIGISDQITFSGWYASADNRSVANLQIISGTVEEDADDAEFETNVQVLDFGSLTSSFDQSGSMDRWSVTHALLDRHLEESSDDEEAMGGEISVQYGLTGTLDAMRPGAIQDVLESSSFGRKPQELRD